MKSPENMIVTLQIGFNSYDMELPSFMLIKDLMPKITETFRCMAPDEYGSLSHLFLLHKGKALPDEKSLAACGIWDGSILKAEVRK